MNKKKLIIGGTAAGVILVAAIFGFVFLKGHSSGSSDSGDLVYVDSVTSIMGLGSGTGQLNRFAGVVEPQKTVTIKQSSDKKVKECYVKEGDEVKKGQKLISFDREAIAAEGYDVITPIVICNSDQFTAIEPHTGTVSVGDVVLTLKK